MTCPRYRFVVIAGRRFLFFADALVVAEGARIFRVGHARTDDRADVVDRDGRAWRVQCHAPEEDDEAPSGELLGFAVDGDGEDARLVFADGRAPIRRVAAVIRQDELVLVWHAKVENPAIFTPRPYPWAR